jgi:hypothetical protein
VSSDETPTETLYRAMTRIFAAVIAAFGIAIIVITLANGGNAAAMGLWIGVIFTGLGLARLYLTLRHDDE